MATSLDNWSQWTTKKDINLVRIVCLSVCHVYLFSYCTVRECVFFNSWEAVLCLFSFPSREALSLGMLFLILDLAGGCKVFSCSICVSKGPGCSVCGVGVPLWRPWGLLFIMFLYVSILFLCLFLSVPWFKLGWSHRVVFNWLSGSPWVGLYLGVLICLGVPTGIPWSG